MPTSSSRLAYGDCYDIFDQAVEDVTGVRVKVHTQSEAIGLRTRLHTARKIDRQDNTKTFERDHPMFGRSQYDALSVKLKELDEDIYVYIEKIQLNYEVEGLSKVKDLEAPRPLKLIEAPKLMKLTEETVKLLESPTRIARRV